MRFLYNPVENAEDIRIKGFAGHIHAEGTSRKPSVLRGELHPGDEYMFEISTDANDLK